MMLAKDRIVSKLKSLPEMSGVSLINTKTNIHLIKGTKQVSFNLLLIMATWEPQRVGLMRLRRLKASIRRHQNLMANLSNKITRKASQISTLFDKNT